MKMKLFTLLLPLAAAFSPSTPSFANKISSKTKLSAIVDPNLDILSQSWINHDSLNSLLLSYSDDPLGDQLAGMNGAVVGAILVAFIGIGAGFTALLPKVGSSAKFTLTEVEEAAIAAVQNGYDAKAWEQELTEEGTKGYVNRRRQANEAKEKYQAGKATRDMKDRSLRYSEAGLGFIASLVRAAEPQPGDKLVTLGSGFGRSTIAAATLFPQFGKCVGIEFLEPLAKGSNAYKGKVRGRKAPVEFQAGDFADADLSGYDIALVTGSAISDKDLGAALTTLPSGAKVMTVDKRLGGGFTLITQVDDPSGDLMLNTGYLYQKN